MNKEMNLIVTRTLLSNWALAMRAQSLSPLTILERVRVSTRVCEYFESSPLLLETEQILEWLASLPTAVTRWTYFTHLRALFRWLEITRQRTDNPLLGLPAPKRPRYSPRPASLAMIEDVLSKPLYRKTRAMILLAFNCGLRVSEIARVSGQHFDPAAKQLEVFGKGGKFATIPVHDDLIEFFSRFPRRAFWFPSPNGGHVKSRSVGDTIVRTFRRYGYDMTSHQLRHSFATELLAAGVDIRIVQELMRHESIQTTALYTRVLHSQQAEATNLLPVFTTNNASVAGVASLASNAGN